MRSSLNLMLLFIAVSILSMTACGQGKGSSDTAGSVAEVVEEALSANTTAEAEDLLRQFSLDGDLEKVTASLEAGTDVNAMDADGRTALMFAAFNGHSELVLKLMEKGAVVDRRDQMGRTALLYAATGPFPETVSILIDKGAKANVVDSDEHFSPLMHAAAEGNLDVVKVLLEAGADPTLVDVDGDDAASFARQGGHMEVANFLETAPSALK